MSALLQRFDARSRLLARALLTAGVNGAQKVFNRLRGCNSHLCLRPFLHTLCQEEAWLEEDTRALKTKPLISLFSDAFKRDLLCFLHIIHPCLPRDNVLLLLRCLSQEKNQKPWVCALIGQLNRDIGDDAIRETLLTPKSAMDLKALCERFRDSQGTGGWDLFLNKGSTFSEDDQTELVNKKRKSVTIDHMDKELEEPQTKRMKMDVSVKEDTQSERQTVDEEECNVKTLQLDQEPEGDSQKTRRLSQEEFLSELPDQIKGAIPLIKELLESVETEWDESCMPTLKVFNECDVKQMEMLCEILHLSEAPEHTLPHFCRLLLALSPDLSHSTATVIVKNLLLRKVLSLTEPASRCLVSAVTSLCSRYPRPTCQALIEPVIKEGQTGTAQAELLCRLAKDCLEPHYRLLVFQQTLVESWNEGLLSVIHTLLDSKIELSEELFSLFINQLSSQSPHFTKSMKFAKMMLTVLTKFQSQVNTACQHTLSCCIASNETFLKKSLQAALKRISH